jgi:hypothetical protein
MRQRGWEQRRPRDPESLEPELGGMNARTDASQAETSSHVAEGPVNANLSTANIGTRVVHARHPDSELSLTGSRMT